jgi:sec-independent protein translocase protein TatA
MNMAFSVLQMNIGGTEWIIIILMGLFLLFGSKKLPVLSRTLGKAAGEYEKARDLLRKEMEHATSIADESTTYFIGPKITAPVGSQREKLDLIANSLGLEHIGKTDEQLRLLISERMQDKGYYSRN